MRSTPLVNRSPLVNTDEISRSQFFKGVFTEAPYTISKNVISWNYFFDNRFEAYLLLLAIESIMEKYTFN